MDTATPTLPEELSPLLASSRLGSTPLSWIPSSAVVPPFQTLLVHDHDMTSELARFHGDSISLIVLNSLTDEQAYLREVTLHAASTGSPVEYGLIEIMLAAFPVALRPKILAGETPLGAILNESGFSYGSQPQGFFTVPARSLDTVFTRSSGGEILFGRYNHLVSSEGRCLARILEILPHAP